MTSAAASASSVIRTIGVIGAGRAGRDFAGECVRAGYAVALEDVMPEKLRQAAAELTEVVGSLGLGSLRLVATVEDAVRSADLVVDFVPDELESKLEIFSMADRMAPPRTILCTPTEALSISDLASCVYRPDRCIAVERLAEADIRIVVPSAASEETIEATSRFLRSLGRTITVAADASEPMLTKTAFQH